MIAVLVAGTFQPRVHAQGTDAAGRIVADHWLVLGPFRHTLICASADGDVLADWVAPTSVQCAYPAVGDEAPFNAFAAESLEYLGPVGDLGFPSWHRLAPGGGGAFVNLGADPEFECQGGDGFDCQGLVSWAATWIEVDAPEDVEVCFSSDDSAQLWIDTTVLVSRGGCRELGECDDRVPYRLEAGVHRVLAASFGVSDRFAFSCAFLADGGPVVDGTEGWTFLGTTRPAFDPPACPDPSLPVAGLRCVVSELGGVDLSWRHPPRGSLEGSLEVSIDGGVVETLAGEETLAVLEESVFDDLGPAEICVRNGSGIAVCCEVLLLEPVADVRCRREADGAVEVRWVNPEAERADRVIEVAVGGETVVTVGGDASSATIAAPLLPAGRTEICVTNASGVPVCCSPQATDESGAITTRGWLVIGPFSVGIDECNGRERDEDLLLEFTAPTDIGCEYPEAGDPIDYDAGVAASLGYVGPEDELGDPFWRELVDGTPDDGTQDLAADPDAGRTERVVSWLATYVSYAGLLPVDVDVCFGVDQAGQVRFDDSLVFNRNTCTAVDPCEHRFSMRIAPGAHRILVGAFNATGEWGAGLAMSIGGEPVTDDSARWPDWTFHGTEPPAASFPCRPAGTERCENGIDDDGDGHVDCDDPDCAGPACGSEAAFRRGDANGDGSADLSDAVFVLNWLFAGGAEPGCLDAADANDDGGVNIASAVYQLNWLFAGGAVPPDPSGECGVDPTPDDLPCASFPPCP